MLKDIVVFCPIHATSLDVMLSIAHSLTQRTNCKALFLLGAPNMLEVSGDIKAEGFCVEEIKPFRGSKFYIPAFLCEKFNRWLHRLILLSASGARYKNILRNCDEFYYRTAKYYQVVLLFLRELRPASVIIPDDRSIGFGFLPAVIKACNKLDIASIIPPISYAADKNTILSCEARTTFVDTYNERLFDKYLSQVVTDLSCNKKLSFYPAITTEILYMLDMLPENPWVMGGGKSSIVLVDGSRTRKRLIMNGCSEKKIKVVGHSSHDALFLSLQNKDILKAKLSNKYGFKKKKLLLLALPQLAEDQTLSWKQHWQEIRFLCSTLRTADNDLLISLHPKMDHSQYKFLEKDYRVAIAEESLRDILPAADYFASNFSSTTEWAVLCRIPTIAFDFYGFNYDIYYNLEGVIVVTKKEKLSSTLANLLSSSGHHSSLIQSFDENIESLSPFDGKCIERIVDICCESPRIVSG